MADSEHDHWRMIQSSYNSRQDGQEASQCGADDHRMDRDKGRLDSVIGATARLRLQNHPHALGDDAAIEIC